MQLPEKYKENFFLYISGEKVKKVPFFCAKVPQLQNEKKYFLNKRPLLLERKCLFCSSKDSIKAISDVIETPYFQKFSFGS
jgi:hypothetical protein